jgi:hypothetical protein
MNYRIASIVVGIVLWMTPVHSEGRPTYDGLRAEVAKTPDCAPREYPELTIVACKSGTLWYFTKPNHPAHPGVIKRFVVEENGQIFMKEEGHSFGPDSAQPTFKAWLAQIQALDRKMIEDIKQRNPKP